MHRGSVNKLDDRQTQLLGDMMDSMRDAEGHKKGSSGVSATDEMY